MAALALSPGRDVNVLGALALARIGDVPRAKVLAQELETNYPSNTCERRWRALFGTWAIPVEHALG
jgi:hypothetical protein